MRSQTTVIITMLALGATALAQSPEQRTSVVKQPWQLTLPERIALRTDRKLAPVRVREHLSMNAPRVGSDAIRRPRLDIISGKSHPELLLPTELFQSVIDRGVIYNEEQQFRESHAKEVAAAGLANNFWDRLEQVSKPFIDDRFEESRLLETAKAEPGQRQKIDERMAAHHAMTCRDRADALRAARNEFGPALDIFLYRYVAREMTIFSDDYFDADQLNAQERGCR